MIERLVRFGPQGDLTGIYTAPGVEASGSPALLLLTAGLLHKVGPNRLHVDLARRLAGEGYASFRFDMSGTGDSAARTDSATELERCVADVAAAMNTIHKRFGHEAFVLFGLCSGADNAHASAVRDARVKGIICLDAYIYPTVRGHLNRILSRLRAITPRKILSLPLGMFRRARGAASGRGAAGGEAEAAFMRPFPPKNELARELQLLADRGVDMLFIYTGGYVPYRYPDHFRDCFRAVDFGSRLNVIYNADANHTYTIGHDRRALMDSVQAWMLRHAGRPKEKGS